MNAACGAPWKLATIAIVMAAAPAFAQNEKLMSKNPSECEVFSALSGDESCDVEPSAGTVGVDGGTQGLSINNGAQQDSGGVASESTKKTRLATTEKTNGATSSGPKAAAFQSIQFEFNSAELTAPTRATLDTVAAVLQEPVFAASRFVIEGHTDSVGSAAFNQLLSERRAQAVVRYLVQHGVAAEHLSARGMGESKPYDPARPDAAVNRRVVVLNLGG